MTRPKDDETAATLGTVPAKSVGAALSSLRPNIKERDVTTPSGRVFTIRPPTMREQFLIDARLTESDQQGMIYYRIMARIVSIDGVILPMISSKEDLQGLMDYVTGDEFDTLMKDYSDNSGLSNLKKSSPAPQSNS